MSLIEERVSKLEAQSFAYTAMFTALLATHPNRAAVDHILMAACEHMEAKSGLTLLQSDEARRLIESLMRARSPSQ